jgi:hypothetical protein
MGQTALLPPIETELKQNVITELKTVRIEVLTFPAAHVRHIGE